MATKANLKKALNGNLTVNVETASKINWNGDIINKGKSNSILIRKNMVMAI
jgi:hypothetical protein